MRSFWSRTRRDIPIPRKRSQCFPPSRTLRHLLNRVIVNSSNAFARYSAEVLANLIKCDSIALLRYVQCARRRAILYRSTLNDISPPHLHAQMIFAAYIRARPRRVASAGQTIGAMQRTPTVFLGHDCSLTASNHSRRVPAESSESYTVKCATCANDRARFAENAGPFPTQILRGFAR